MQRADVTDSEIIERSRRDPEAFVELFRRHFRAVHGYVARRAGHELADEVAAETFTQAFRGRAAYVAQGSSALPWLYGIAGRQLLRRQRRERRHLRALGRLADRRDVAPDHGDKGVSSRHEQRALAAALAALEARDREVLLLLAWADLSYAEIAEATAVPIGTVRSRISRARRIVREALSDEGHELALTCTEGGATHA
jgi:RNA polymerase sigma factor (sigma-70 family)